eukprot:13581119-Alexandrium_andersonii.AAC.1
MGFPSWSTTFAPCFLCACTKEQLFNFHGVSLLRDPWGARQVGDYEESWRSCEIHVQVNTEADRDAIIRGGDLFYDKRKSGGRGRVLRHAVP